MARQVVLQNARLFTGVDGEVIEAGAVVVDGALIRYAGPSADLPALPDDAARRDLGGRFLMPGMTESHAHLSYSNANPGLLDREPLTQAMLHAADNARVLLGSGFTSAISFGSAQGVDVPLRDAIERGQLLGPRLAASERDIGSTGSNADIDAPGSEGRKRIADGPWAVRSAVRELAKARCDIVKIFLDGEAISEYAPPGVISYTDVEVASAVEETHARGMRIVCHARSAEAVKQALRHGVDIIGHANYLDDEAVDMLRAQRDRIFVGPAIAWEVALLERSRELGMSREAVEKRGYRREVEETISAVKRLREVGVRVLIGGDYGLSITPHGSNAKDLEYFVDLFGMSPVEALLCATRDGGAAADPDGMVGTLEEGKYADLIVLNGDPRDDVAILQDHSRIAAVMKGGQLYTGLLDAKPWLRAPDDPI